MAETADTTDAQHGSTDGPDMLPFRTLEQMQHWTCVMGRAQQLMMAYLARQMVHAPESAPDPAKAFSHWTGWFADPGTIVQQQLALWNEGMDIWQRALGTKEG